LLRGALNPFVTSLRLPVAFATQTGADTHRRAGFGLENLKGLAKVLSTMSGDLKIFPQNEGFILT